MKIAIIGTGYVGSAFKELVSGRYETITYDVADNIPYPQEMIDSSDVAVVCVPTPMAEDGSCDTSIVEAAIEKINGPLILIKSTVSPGTTARLAEKTGKRICFSPEYIGESTYNNPIYKTMADTPFLIVGGQHEDVEKIFTILEPIMGPHCRYFACSSTEAEVIKYMENSFLAMKVSFVNEFYEIAKTFDTDWHTVREGWLLDERIGRPFTSVFKNARGFSGKCLPKDVNGIVKASEAKGFTPTILKSILAFNDKIRKEPPKWS